MWLWNSDVLSRVPVASAFLYCDLRVAGNCLTFASLGGKSHVGLSFAFFLSRGDFSFVERPSPFSVCFLCPLSTSLSHFFLLICKSSLYMGKMTSVSFVALVSSGGCGCHCDILGIDGIVCFSLGVTSFGSTWNCPFILLSFL